MRKKKVGKKKSKKKDDAEPVETSEVAGTPVSGVSATKKKKGKKGRKGKKGKKSLSERRREKLEKASEKLIKNETFVENFTERMDKWLQVHADLIVTMFVHYDDSSTGMVTYEVFKSGLFDLNLPCNQVEQHLLCRLLDPRSTGTLAYTDFTDGIETIRERAMNVPQDGDDHKEKEEELVDKLHEDDDIEVIGEHIGRHVTSGTTLQRYEPPERCVCCKMAVCLPYHEKKPKYVDLLVRLAYFENMRDHPGHFNQLVHTHLPIIGLIQLIKNTTGTNSTRIGVFLDNSPNAEILDQTKTLDDYAVEGGDKAHAPKALLYYDYSVEFIGCPLLNYDHYFTHAKRNLQHTCNTRSLLDLHL